MSESVCYCCGWSYYNLNNHFKQSPICLFPEFSSRQEELLKGLTMGDGSITRSREGGNFRMAISSVNEVWLRWIYAQFGDRLATEPQLSQDGEAAGEQARQYESFDDSGGEWEYSDVYEMAIRSHPHLTEMRETWYPDDEICFPDDLSLTPALAKTWYCSDGGLSWSDGTPHVNVGTWNESYRPEFLLDLFREHGFEPTYSEPLIRLFGDGRDRFLDWIAPAPAGFKYKWETESRERYDALKGGVA